MMRILFIGSANSSKFLLKKCFELKINIVGVCTQKKSSNDDFCDLKKYFRLNSDMSFYAKDINSFQAYKWIKNKKPDYIFCFGWSQILKNKIIRLAKVMTIGFHPSELPKNRGRHPIIWSLVLGLKKTASTFFIIRDEKVDSGKIISQKIVPITKFDDASTLYNKIIKVSSSQIKNLVKKKIKVNKFKKILFTKKTNYWRKRNFADGKIDWRMSSVLIYNLIRALSKPYTNALFHYKKREVKILKAKIIKSKDDLKTVNFEPGKILKKTSTFFDVKCGEGIIRVLKIDKPNRFKLHQYL